MEELKIFRGSWIPFSDNPRNQRFVCPFCNEQVRMMPGDPTYPTCPWCLSDMPEAEDFETPEELLAIKRGNKSMTNKTYSIDPADNEAKRARRRQWYADHPEQCRENSRKYYAEHREEILARQRARYREDPSRKLEYQRRYTEEHREEINRKRREERAADPEKFREQQRRYRGKPMREVKAHISGVPVEEIPEAGFYFGKGVKR